MVGMTLTNELEVLGSSCPDVQGCTNWGAEVPPPSHPGFTSNARFPPSCKKIPERLKHCMFLMNMLEEILPFFSIEPCSCNLLDLNWILVFFPLKWTIWIQVVLL